MTKIKHIAVITHDPEKTAAFYREVFGLTETTEINTATTKGYYLSDGDVNLAILSYKDPRAAGPGFPDNYVGLWHIGLQVDDLPEAKRRLAKAGAKATGKRPADEQDRTARLQFAGPDGVLIDVNETGWWGTS